ncbi:MAG: phosphatase PAP2 family protein [Bacteroidia bacterium]|nr:phosphatase PAP2 family protein [Bacteroidia bacterium]
MLQKTIIGGLLGLAILLFLLWKFDIAFSAQTPQSFLTHFTFFLTQSAGPIGTLLGILLACFLYTVNEIGIKNKLLVFGKAMLGLIVIISVFAAINEKLTKPIFKFQRPSHVYMLQQINAIGSLDSLYNLSKEERIAFFENEVKNQAVLFSSIDSDVLHHWIAEGGYSFPSGHTFNAFLLAMIFSFGIGNNSYAPKLQKLFFLPFLWAMGIGLSRVALGVHSWIDVSAGAAMGIVVGSTLLYMDYTRNLITHKKQN